MPFTLVKGSLHIVGSSPDGDSVKFKADSVSAWKKIEGARSVKLNARGLAQLRLQGIDALETHFQGTHQPVGLGRKATELLLELAGFKEVTWGPAHYSVTSVAEDGLPAHILTNEVETNRRPVAFLFAGVPSKPDGAEVFLEPKMLAECLNVKLAAAGLAYPMYYTGLYAELREVFTRAVLAARKAKKGLWPADGSTSGVSVAPDLTAVREDVPLFPKLFRRLVEYFAQTPRPTSLAKFKAYLESRGEQVWFADEAAFRHFDDAVEVDGNTVRLVTDPENLIFGSGTDKPK
jgi:hypothetical protein